MKDMIINQQIEEGAFVDMPAVKAGTNLIFWQLLIFYCSMMNKAFYFYPQL